MLLQKKDQRFQMAVTVIIAGDISLVHRYSESCGISDQSIDQLDTLTSFRPDNHPEISFHITWRQIQRMMMINHRIFDCPWESSRVERFLHCGSTAGLSRKALPPTPTVGSSSIQLSKFIKYSKKADTEFKSLIKKLPHHPDPNLQLHLLSSNTV
jgi:hypothetical protein